MKTQFAATWLPVWLCLPALASAYAPTPCQPPLCTVAILGEDVQAVLDAAPPHSTVVADPRREIVVSKTIRVTKPLTIVGLRARLKAGLLRTPLMEVLSEGVTIRGFVLTGNIASVPYEDRASLIVLRRGRFLVEQCEFLDSAKDGVMVNPEREGPSIEHGVIRNIIGRNNARDLVSIAGLGELGFFVRHVLVENLRCYGSRDRGAAEASDGSEFITFRDVYSESSVYGIDVQDHNRAGQTNRHILIDHLHVRDCVSAVRTANRDFGHLGLVIRNVTGESFRKDQRWTPLHILNTRDVVMENIHLDGTVQGAVLHGAKIGGLIVRDVTLRNLGKTAAAIYVEDVNEALFDNVVLQQGEPQADIGIQYRISGNAAMHSLRVRNCLLGSARNWDLSVERQKENAVLQILATDETVTRAKVDIEPQVRRIGGY